MSGRQQDQPRREALDLEALDRALESIRFAPRESLGPEVSGRVRRGERSKGVVRPRRIRSALLALAAGIGMAVLVALLVTSQSRRAEASVWSTVVPVPVIVDRCCYDLDGGGRSDDGIRLVAEPNARVHRLWLYEDRDHSGGYSAGDVIRLERGDSPTLSAAAARRLITTRHCCVDFDGGGPADDGLVVLGTPPDRVAMAAIYERPRESAGRPTDAILR
jgi:hypothetical protein